MSETIESLQIPVGDAYWPDDNTLASPYIGADSIFEGFEIQHFEPGVYYAEAYVPVDFHEGYAAILGVPGRYDDGTDFDADEASGWLNDRQQQIEAFFRERYGVVLDGDEWCHQHAVFTIPVSPDQSVEDAFDALWNGTRAVQLYNELDAGTYGCEYVWRVLRDHFQRQEA